MKLFEEKLGELDPGFGVELMILSAPEVEAWTGAQDMLPETAPITANPLGEDGTIDLADRLALRLGEGNVVRLLPRDSHIPERVQTVAPISAPAAPDGAWARLASMKGVRPTRLLQRPELVETMAEVPDEPPRRSSGAATPIASCASRAPSASPTNGGGRAPAARSCRPTSSRRCATTIASRTTTAAASGCSATAR